AVDTAVFAARRRAVLAGVGRGVVLVPAAHARDLEREYLQDNDFRQSNTFFYLTGLETADAWLVLARRGADTVDATLLLPPRNPGAERWTGLRLGPDSSVAVIAGVRRVLPLDSLDAVVGLAVRRAGGPLHVPLDPTTEREPWVDALLHESRFGAADVGADVRNLRPVVDSLRMVKDADEVARLRRAIDITIEGHLAALHALRPGLWEYQLESVIEGAFRWHGADRVGFPSIVGSGPNSTTLHYDVNRRQMQDGELVVVDIGAEWGQYTADVTRTLPVSGRFTQRQRAIYELVLGAQQAAFAATRPGVTLGELHRIAADYLRAHSGSLCGEVTCDRYFVHGLSHHLGMDVHDVGVAGRGRLEPGMVFTIEPGVYLPAEDLGVRIEDDVLVTATGAEWLSGHAPRSPQEIERAMRATGAAGRR
ncbi:MAG: aminopeptidase P N-terminal domain-containing protein, partial [Acidimicrobiales bacterium]